MRAASDQPEPESESRSWRFLLGALLISTVGHVITLFGLPSRPVQRAASKPLEVEMKFIEAPKPPPEPEKPAEAPKPPPKVPQVKVAQPKPVPIKEPPPPTEEAPPEPDAKPPPVVIGLSLSNTNAAGSFAVQTGNSVMGKTDTTAVDPNSVKKYSAPKYVPAGGADSDPVIALEPQIPYPPEAKKADVEGAVRLKLTIDFEGHVVDVVVISGPGYGLNEAAAEGIKRFRFKPAMKNGEPVSTTIAFLYRFELD